MTPPPRAAPVALRHSTDPLLASRASTSPFKSPVKTKPLAVGVTAASMGVGDLYFQRTLPVSASRAVSQPPHISLGSVRPNGFLESPETGQMEPRFPVMVAASATFTDAHQSTELTSSKFNWG